ncbi:hypothetical protein HID58_089905, partial [Brassica napus]
QAERKYSRTYQRPQTAGARWPNYRGPEERGPHDSSRGVSPRHSSDKSSGFEENRRRYDDRSIHRSRTPIYSRKSPSNRSLQERDTPRLSERGGEPHTKNSKEDKSSPSIEASSNSKRSPPKELALVRRSSLASRLSDPLTQKSTSGERVPAKERLSVHTQRTSTPDLRDSLSGSKRRHEDGEIHMEENVLPVNNIINITRPSSSTVFESGRLGPGDRSPIRTLSEDRIHVSLRLGSLGSETTSEGTDISDLPDLSKAEGKKKLTKPQDRKRVARSPVQGVSLKKRRVTKSKESPRRKLMMDAIVAGGRGLSDTLQYHPLVP